MRVSLMVKFNSLSLTQTLYSWMARYSQPSFYALTPYVHMYIHFVDVRSVYLCTWEKLIYLARYLFGRIDDKANGKVGQRRKRGDIEDVKKPASKRRRTTSSPKRVENNYEPIEECCANVNDDNRNRYASNGDNYRATSERRKSTASREDGSRIERQKPGTSVDDVDRDDERRGNDDDEKSEEASVERDANGTTEEIIDV